MSYTKRNQNLSFKVKDIALKIARILLKVASKEEIDTVSEWGKKSDLNASFIDNIKIFWDRSVEQEPLNRLNSARYRLLIRIKANKTGNRKKLFSSYLIRIAAVFIFMVSIAGLSFYIASETNFFHKNNRIEISTEAGQRSKIILPDGSLVWLNAETVVKYSSDKKERMVNLSGEAYFEVSHSSDYPFVVKTDNAKIKVLGTKFNVSHFPSSEITKATLLSGEIEMSSDKNDKSVKLKPGEKIIYNEKKQTFTEIQANVENEILWTQGILVFDNESFNELIIKLERYYAVNFIYNKDVFENIHYTGTIDNLSVNNVLEFINLTISINYEINNKTIKLSLTK